MIDVSTKPTSRTVLVCIDVQQDFVPPLQGDGKEAAPVRQIRSLVDDARSNGIPVVFIRELHNQTLVDLGREADGYEGLHCVEGTPGAEFIAGFGPLPTEYQVRKRRYSAFFGTDLDIILRGYGAETVLLVGGLTDVCVHYTAVDAHQHDYRVKVISDAVFGSSPAAHSSALEAVHYLQMGSVIETTEARMLMTSAPVAVA
ncbi:MAG TPA: isochorismatase family cysteine hydrolase [Pseudolysinimonas sp.]|nr:isochorismatase family cysteine hydrolase [Pseudolysinimonas sp.]